MEITTRVAEKNVSSQPRTEPYTRLLTGPAMWEGVQTVRDYEESGAAFCYRDYEEISSGADFWDRYGLFKPLCN
ncbi:hypothetical protein Bca101_083653 [Brassica carinata]